jgi:Uma2 family endonuclease
MPAAGYGMTVEEYRAKSHEGDRTQLIDGVVVVTESKPIHGLAQGALIFALGEWVGAGTGRGMVLPPVNVALTDRDSYGPDVVWFSEDHVPDDLTQDPERVPDLVVEVRSPSTWRFDIGRKRYVYETHGVPELWLVDPYEQMVTVCRRTDPRAPTFDIELPLGPSDLLRSPQLPGFQLPIESLFTR